MLLKLTCTRHNVELEPIEMEGVEPEEGFRVKGLMYTRDGWKVDLDDFYCPVAESGNIVVAEEGCHLSAWKAEAA